MRRYNCRNTGHYDGVHFILTDDIDMAGVTDFIGASLGSIFPGLFQQLLLRPACSTAKATASKILEIKSVAFDADGNPHQEWGAGQSRKWVGLFGKPHGVEAVVRNVIIDESCRFEALTFVGGIAERFPTTQESRTAATTAQFVCYD